MSFSLCVTFSNIFSYTSFVFHTLCLLDSLKESYQIFRMNIEIPYYTYIVHVIKSRNSFLQKPFSFLGDPNDCVRRQCYAIISNTVLIMNYTLNMAALLTLIIASFMGLFLVKQMIFNLLHIYFACITKNIKSYFKFLFPSFVLYFFSERFV